jgi:hypothetical protein
MIGATIVCLVGLQNYVKCSVCRQTYHKTNKVLTPAYVRTLASRSRPRYSATQIKAMEWICKRESTYRVNERDPRSTAYGLYGFLKAQWKEVGIPKSDCPTCQTRAAIRYIEKRFKTPEKAKEFWKKHGWY